MKEQEIQKVLEIIAFILKAIKEQGCNEQIVNNYLDEISKLSNANYDIFLSIQ